MRMANDRDQALLRSAVNDATADLLAFVPSLGTREVIAFGEGVPFPARMQFKTLPDASLLRSEAVGDGSTVPDLSNGAQFVQEVVDRWRHAVTGGRKLRVDEPAPQVAPASEPGEFLSASSRLDQARYQLLRR